MRQKQSTKTSAPTGIDDSRQYVLMSPELESFIDFEEPKRSVAPGWRVNIDSGDGQLSYDVISLENTCDGGYMLLIRGTVTDTNLVSCLLDLKEIKVFILDRTFKAKVSKLESDRAYLILSR